MDKIEMMRVFTVVARLESFSKAADELDIAVQTVSKYIKVLEEDLDIQLFDRTTRKVSLNPTGRAYLERCHELLDQFEELESSVKQAHTAPKGKIRMSAPTAFGELHLVPALASFQALYPDVTIELDLSNRRVSIVDEGFDLALRIGQLTDSSMVARKLSDMRVVVCASNDYLMRAGKPAHPSELKDHRCLIDSNFRGGRHWPFVENGQEFQVDITGSFQANSPTAIRRLVKLGQGIGLCPIYVLSDELLSGEVTILFESMEAIHFGVYALYPHRKHLSVRVRMLVEHLQQEFRKTSFGARAS